MEEGSLRDGSSSKKFKKPRRKNIQNQQTNPFNTPGYHPYVPMQGFAPYSPGTQQQFNRWEQSFVHDQSSQQFEWQQQQFHQQSPFQDYREPNNDESDSSDQNKTVQLESDEEEEPVRAPEKRPKGRKAAKRWSDEKEVALAKSWLTVSENPEVGNAQKRDGFYRKKLNGFYQQASMSRKSGEADNDVLKKALKDHTCYQDPMLQLILDRKREIAARWGWHCPF
ncbi:hypothetical protein R6Q57_023540 [Mikania cordata]